MSAVTIDLEQDLLNLLGDSPEALGQTLRELAVLERYRRHATTGSQGAKRLGVTLEAFLKLAGSRHIPIFDITPDELREEVRDGTR